MRDLNVKEMNEVNGGVWNFLVGWAVGHGMSKGADAYYDWVVGGAGGWVEEYNPEGYADPLL